MPRQSTKDVWLMNMTKSPINMFLRGAVPEKPSIRTGHTLFPGVKTQVDSYSWKQYQINPAVKGMVERGTMVVLDSSAVSDQPLESLHKKVTEPQLPPELDGQNEVVGEKSLVSPAEVTGTSELKITTPGE